jgi:hypothetical protein
VSPPRKKLKRGFNNRIAFILLAMLGIFLAGLPLSAQQAKQARKEGGVSEAKRDRSPQVVEKRHKKVVEENQVPKRDRKNAEVRHRAQKNVRPEDETRIERKPRKGLPIIEGPKGERIERKAPDKPFPKRQTREPAPQPVLREEANERVRGTLDRFRQSWMQGDSRALTELLSNESRVKISIESKDINDSFGRGQAQYVLREYVISADNRDLNFSRFRVSPADGNNAYGVGKMRMRDRKTGKISNHTVYVSMVREGEKWAVREIRISD